MTRPAWLDDTIFYQVYPQSFLDTDADGIGDLRGIIQKLPYLEELGCNGIWLNPCFVSPFGDAGYDVADYLTVAPRYGTNQDLKDLFDAAHARGMHVLLDLVAGHTSIEHPWFKASCRAQQNPFTDRYVWTDRVFELPDDMPSICGMSERDGACAVNFFSHQPALNYGFYDPDPNKSWQQPMNAPGPAATLQALKDVMRFWLDLGADGFRVDMAGSLVKGDPEQEGTMALWRDVRAMLDREYPQAALVSEWGQPDRALSAGFHMDFLLQFGTSHYNDLARCEEPYFSSRCAGDASAFVDAYEAFYEKTSSLGQMCLVSGNHDCDRLARRLSDDELKVAFAFQLTMPGVPFIYYGDEIGMRQTEGLPSKEGSYWRTGVRTPMQWDSTPNAGFSAAAPERLYLPVDDAPDRPTVAAQMAEKGSLWRCVQELASLRHRCPGLQAEAGIRFLSAGKDGAPLAYLRGEGADRLLVAVNPSAQAQSFCWEERPGETLFSLGQLPSQTDGALLMAPQSALVCRMPEA